MCRNIKPLFNFEPPATPSEIRDASLQFVRKVSGMTAPTGRNQIVCEEAVTEIATAIERLMGELSTSAVPKNREIEAAKARERSAKRFAPVA